MQLVYDKCETATIAGNPLQFFYDEKIKINPNP